MYLLKNTPIGPLMQNPITEQWAMGLNRAQGFLQFFLIYSFVILIFLSNAVIFVPLGHLVSRLMRKQDKLKMKSSQQEIIINHEAKALYKIVIDIDPLSML